ncbi:MAG: GNAT family N-acetyltransferase [Chloroflexota bacterium]
MDAIRQIEYISLRAWQALETEIYDGWILRASEGYTRRANSVQPLSDNKLPLSEKIAYCEAWYAERDLPCIFRLTPAHQPTMLDNALDERNYTRSSSTFVQTAPLSALVSTPDEAFHYTDTLQTDWLFAWGKWNSVPTKYTDVAQRMLTQPNRVEMCFGWIDDSAVGLAVYEDYHVGLFDIVVHPDQRGKGIGERLVRQLLAWGKNKSAEIAYLQVVANNAPAIHLYAKLGFTTHHVYWYRAKDMN